ncbi:MAG: HipA domain-containing protein, partial [Planctomycetota bacterium]
SGQVPAPEGFGYWLLKFDGVDENSDKELNDPQGFGALEYAYSLMARAAGLRMSDCRLLEEHGRRHFMTRRFDRTPSGDKLHMQSLCALAHLDFNAPGAHSYEEAVLVIRRLGLSMRQVEEQYRRAAFNIVARNQDDHVKNIAFLMDRDGRWSLSPAYDVTYSFNPAGPWTRQHQMSFNRKRDGFTREDFRDFGRTVGMKRTRPDEILDEVLAAVARWPDFAAEVGVEPTLAREAERHHRVGSLRA